MAVASSGRAGSANVLSRLLANVRILSPLYAANALTIARLICAAPIVFFLVSGEATTAFWLFTVAAASDAADGFVAKRFNGMTVLGAILDPIADKLLTGSLFVALAYEGSLAFWLALLVVTRDASLLVGTPLLRDTVLGGQVRPLIVGKVSTLVQFLFLGATLAVLAGYSFFKPLLPSLEALVVCLTIVSALAYGSLAFRKRQPPSTDSGWI